MSLYYFCHIRVAAIGIHAAPYPILYSFKVIHWIICQHWPVPLKYGRNGLVKAFAHLQFQHLVLNALKVWVMVHCHY